MKLTKENKLFIDSLDYEDLLRKWRFDPVGSSWFQGETGDYWLKRMQRMKSLVGGNAIHSKASKDIGW